MKSLTFNQLRFVNTERHPQCNAMRCTTFSGNTLSLFHVFGYCGTAWRTNQTHWIHWAFMLKAVHCIALQSGIRCEWTFTHIHIQCLLDTMPTYEDQHFHRWILKHTQKYNHTRSTAKTKNSLIRRHDKETTLTCWQGSWCLDPQIQDPLLPSSPSSAASDIQRSHTSVWTSCSPNDPAHGLLSVPSTATNIS